MIYQSSNILDNDAKQFLLYHQNIINAQNRAYEYLNQFWYGLSQELSKTNSTQSNVELIPSIQQTYPIGLRYYLNLNQEQGLKFSFYDIRSSSFLNSGHLLSCAMKIHTQELKRFFTIQQINDLLKHLLTPEYILTSQNDENSAILVLSIQLLNLSEDIKIASQMITQIIDILHKHLINMLNEQNEEYIEYQKISSKSQSQENYSLSQVSFDIYDKIEINHEILNEIKDTQKYTDTNINTQNEEFTNPYKNNETPVAIPSSPQTVPKYSFVKSITSILPEEQKNQNQVESLIKAISEIGLEPIKMNPYANGGIMIWFNRSSYINFMPNGTLRFEGKNNDFVTKHLKNKGFIFVD
jgi:hypothetical protein